MAQLNIKHYVTQHLPEQYALALYALDTILKHVYEILQNANDNREKLQALTLFKDTHLQKLELLSNSTTIEQALQFIKSKQSQQQSESQREVEAEVQGDLPPMQQQEEQSTEEAEAQEEQPEEQQQQPIEEHHHHEGRHSVF
jgi:hypothetical protein